MIYVYILNNEIDSQFTVSELNTYVGYYPKESNFVAHLHRVLPEWLWQTDAQHVTWLCCTMVAEPRVTSLMLNGKINQGYIYLII